MEVSQRAKIVHLIFVEVVRFERTLGVLKDRLRKPRISDAPTHYPIEERAAFFVGAHCAC